MPAMLDAFLLSVRQLGDKRILAVFLKSMLLTLAIFAALGIALWFGTDALVRHYLEGSEATATAASTVVLLIGLLGGWLLFRAIAVAVIGVFADEVVHAVEAKHYPARFAAARDLSFARSLGMGMRSAVRALLVNLVLVPLYIVLLVTGVGTALAFFLVNSWLLGRDLGDMVAVRHLPDDEIARWRGATRPSRFTLGAAGTALFFVPFVNFVAPVLGAAMATHLFHRRTVN